MYILDPKMKWLCLLAFSACCGTRLNAAPLITKAVSPATYGLYQQQQPIQETITGIVRIYGKNGRPEAIPGISVIEKGTTNGTVTAAAGAFTLRVKAGATLTFSMIGYKPRELNPSPGSPVNIILEEDISALKEVVVTGYQTIDRKLSPVRQPV